MRKAIRPVAAAAVLMTLAGCGSGGGPPWASPDPAPSVNEDAWPAPVPEEGLAKGMVLPIEQYLVSYPDSVAWERARQSLWKSCMGRFGFAFDPPEPGLYPLPGYNDANMQRRYGITDPEVAAEFGYHLPDDPGEPPVWEPGQGAEEAVFRGGGPSVSGGRYQGEPVPEGGCLGESQRKLGHYDYTLAGQVEFASLEESQKRPEVRAALGRWSACMKQNGYTVEHPYKTPNLLGKALGAEQPSREELSLAVTDVKCKETSDLVRTWFTAETQVQKRRIEENQLALDEEWKANEAVLKKAAKING
ncbi:hypothetical protein V1J52_04925 [Streptomyces sp. TRM 70351]|uniref:hypothetical protein n=1 Tax=Streptomyces sp. TRM 70351 TaxID=3116552 RepID=UPI002E7C0103|nr:hypothetical protein [Streptomyces sp. TRM 70351]MEE1927536.1 hypothetical protein [Streptomyces sp. TRM 70351]